MGFSGVTKYVEYMLENSTRQNKISDEAQALLQYLDNNLKVAQKIRGTVACAAIGINKDKFHRIRKEMAFIERLRQLGIKDNTGESTYSRKTGIIFSR